MFCSTHEGRSDLAPQQMLKWLSVMSCFSCVAMFFGPWFAQKHHASSFFLMFFPYEGLFFLDELWNSTFQRPLTETFTRLLLRNCEEVPYRGSCQESSYRQFLQRSHKEILPRDLYRGLVQRSCQDTSYGDRVQRHCIEICCRDFAKRSLAEILPIELL